jgi:hypothetical protein
MTPAEWTTFVNGWFARQEREERRTITAAWLTARLYRSERLPSLESLFEKPVEAVELPPEEAQRQQELHDVIRERLAARKRQQAEAAR